MSKIKGKILDATKETVGAAVSAGVGSVIAGPAGAIVGATLGSILSNVGSDMLSRLLSQKEKERIDQVRKAVIKKIEENNLMGKALRNDEFFSDTINGRPTAEEIYEGVLLASQKEYEERKIVLLGRLFANIAYDSSITRPIANALIKEASDMTYQQLMIIKIVGILQFISTNGLDPRKNNTSNQVTGLTNISIATDIVILYHKSMIQSSEVIFDAAGINPSLLTLVGNGAQLFKLMELDKTEIDNSEADILKYLTNNASG